MGCTGRYAEAWEFAAFWCTSSLLRGFDDSGGAGNPHLTDADGKFLSRSVVRNEGMVLYNLTAGTSGPVTDVTSSTLSATGVTWSDGDEYRIVTITGEEIATIEHFLDVAANDIFAALAAVAACDCNLADWAAGFLNKLNIIDAASWYNCQCGQPSLSDEARAGLIEWCNQQLNAIREGMTEVCHGATGAGYPAMAFAQQARTSWAAAQLIYDQLVREGF